MPTEKILTFIVVGQALPDKNILFNYFKGFMLMQLNL